MELGFIENLRRRWDILGINGRSGDKNGEGGETTDVDDPSLHILPELGETVAVQESVEEVEGTNSRKEIMQGAIVKSVMSSAVQGTLTPVPPKILGSLCLTPYFVSSSPKDRALRSIECITNGVSISTAASASDAGASLCPSERNAA